MKQYCIEVTQTYTLFVDADSDDDAIISASQKAFEEVPDTTDAVILYTEESK